MKTKLLVLLLMVCLVLGITACNLVPSPDSGNKNPPSTDTTPEEDNTTEDGTTEGGAEDSEDAV